MPISCHSLDYKILLDTSQKHYYIEMYSDAYLPDQDQNNIFLTHTGLVTRRKSPDTSLI